MRESIVFKKDGIVSSSLYGDLPVKKFLTRFEKDLKKEKIYNAIVDFENKNFSFDRDNMFGTTKSYFLEFTKTDIVNFNNNNENKGIKEFISLLKIQLDRQERAKEQDQRQNERKEFEYKMQAEIDKKLAAIDERQANAYEVRIERYQSGVFLTEDEKLEYKNYLKSENTPISDSFSELGDSFSDLNSPLEAGPFSGFGVLLLILYCITLFPFVLLYRIIKNKIITSSQIRKIKKVKLTDSSLLNKEIDTAKFSTNVIESKDEILRQIQQMSGSILYTLDNEQDSLKEEMANIIREYAEGITSSLSSSDSNVINAYNATSDLKAKIISKLGLLQLKIDASQTRRAKIESFNRDLEKVAKTQAGVGAYTKGYTDDISGGVATAKQR